MTDLTATDAATSELAETLRRADPAALLVPSHILRRVIKRHRGLGGLGLQVPHRKCYVVDRDELLALASREELRIPADRDLAEMLVLLTEPETADVTKLGPALLRLRYWRLLFHAFVHLTLDRLFEDGKRGEADAASRMVALGTIEFDEARAVLRQENLLLTPRDDRITYVEFAALYLELRSFDPRRLSHYFPGLGDHARVDRLLAEDVDRKSLFARTRLEGAAEPGCDVELQEYSPESFYCGNQPESPAVPDTLAATRLLARADKDRLRGNDVRSSVRRQRAVNLLPQQDRASPLVGAAHDLDHLAQRLQNALDLPQDEIVDWRAALDALLPGAASGIWTAEARLLYDLQKVCTDHERMVHIVDVMEWVINLGQQPVRRHLPHQGLVLAVKDLRGAARRLPAVRLPAEVRRRFVARLLAAVARCEQFLRNQFRPVVRAALTEVGLVPASFAERVARDKLVEELLDRVAERGHLSMGDLRDAVARNRLKLNDLGGRDGHPAVESFAPSEQFLSGVGRATLEFLRGDCLIRANRTLAVRLDGVYRHGEIYLRWLQRFSALLFGTRPGRFLTRYLLLPFGGSFVLLEGIQFLVDELTGGGAHHHTIRLHKFFSVPVFGFLFLALLHLPRFRGMVKRGLGAIWNAIRFVVVGVPAWITGLPLVRRIVQSRIYLALYQAAFKPAAYAGLTTLVVSRTGTGTVPAASSGAGVFLLTGILLNSRVGQRFEELAADRLVRTWLLVSHDLLPGLYSFILYVFRRMVDEVERVLYTVDEWLRFRTGEGRLSGVVKAVLGVFWFFATYLIRIVINLFVEPTFNPIKHFPVVTVAAKFLVPAVPELVRTAAAVLAPFLGVALGGVLATVAVFLLPGFAGFLVWEFKENWKLYRANQPPSLLPEPVGSHGETLARLLRPGFHSGTVPKLYARLRHAGAKAARKQHEGLHHVGVAVRHFVERGLFPYLDGSRRWGGDRRLRVGEIRLGVDRIRIELHCRGFVCGPLCLDFDEQGGRLIAGVSRAGWLGRLSPPEYQALSDGLAGLYHRAGVELVREQLQAVLPPNSVSSVTEGWLRVWPGPGFQREAAYDFSERGKMSPVPLRGEVSGLPTLSSSEVFLWEHPIRWEDWVRTWQKDKAGADPKPLLQDQFRFLPDSRTQT